MPAAHYGSKHRKAREVVLAEASDCAYCGQPIGWDGKPGVADHSPPIALHDHREDSGCCTYEASCTTCSLKQAGQVSKLVGKMGATEIVFAEPPPSPGPSDAVWDSAPWLDEVREVPDDATWPRWMTAPHPAAIGSYGDTCIRYCAEQWGVELRWWQRLVVLRLFEHDLEGRLVWRRAFWSVARQLGKSWIIKLACLHFAENLERYVPKASVDTTVLLVSRRLIAAEAIIDSTQRWVLDEGYLAGWKTGRSKGQKYVQTPAGHLVIPRSLDATFGTTNGLAVGDEIWDVKAEDWDDGVAMTVSAVAGVQWLTSTANDKATSFSLNLRADAFEQLEAPERLFLIEWASDRKRSRDDRDGWREASPHWDQDREDLIADWLSSADRGVTIDPGEPDPHKAFDANARNVWPVRQMRRGRGEELVAPADWGAALNTAGVPVSGRIVAVEDDYGRNLSVVVAGQTATGRLGVTSRTFSSKADGWDFVRSIDRVEKFCIGASLLSEPATRDLAPVQACSSAQTRVGLQTVRSLVESGALCHTGEEELAEQLLNCRVRSTPSGLAVASAGDRSLVSALAWALDESNRRSGVNARVF